MSSGSAGAARGKANEKLPAYALITPARNEAAFIGKTLESMTAQTVLPVKWVIVSDGSTDGTDDIVKQYARGRDWIELIRMPERRERHFAGKVHAFNAGLERLRGLDYDVIGNLDADISFDRDHFEFLLGKFAENQLLGVAGTAFVENAGVAYDYQYTDIQHVSGQCQLFRRECFESVGGYTPRKMGGIDLVAVLTARMKGWQTRSFTEKVFVHHRVMGTGMYGQLMFVFKGGQVDYMLGNHPVWEVSRSLYQMKKKPYFFRGFLRMTGYFWAVLKGMNKDVPEQLVAFRRKEQMERLKKFFSRLFGFSHEKVKI